MAYDNEIPIPDKFLMPDGSIVTFAGAEYAPADEDRAIIYAQMQYKVAKWLLPDGSIVSGIPVNLSTVAITGGSIRNTTIAPTLITKSASGSLTVAECTGTIIHLYGQTEDATFEIPPAFAEGSFTFVVDATVAKHVRLDPTGSEVQSLDGTDLAPGYYVGLATAVKGAVIQFIAIRTGESAYQWAAYSVTGTWVAQT